MNTKVKIGILFFIFWVTSESCFSQKVNQNISHDQLLRDLRSYRKDWASNFGSVPGFDTLVISTTTVINLIKRVYSHQKDNAIHSYFRNVHETIAAQNTKALKVQTVELVNGDLKRKLLDSLGHELNLETASSFFRLYTIHINATLNNKKIKDGYHLYWTTYLGPSVEPLIKSNKFEGISPRTSNPFSAEIPIPGYIAFWLKKPGENLIYRTDPDYYPLLTQMDTLDCTFISPSHGH